MKNHYERKIKTKHKIVICFFALTLRFKKPFRVTKINENNIQISSCTINETQPLLSEAIKFL